MPESFDFSTVTVTDAPLPKHAGGRKPKYAENPFREAVADSYNMEVGKAVTVPKRMVKDTISLLRKAAGDYKMGIRIVPSVRLDAPEYATMTDDANVTISFQAKPKRKYNPKTTPVADVVTTVDTETTPDPAPTPAKTTSTKPTSRTSKSTK